MMLGIIAAIGIQARSKSLLDANAQKNGTLGAG